MTTTGFSLESMLAQDFSIVRLLANAAVVIILGQILSWHYLRFADVLSNKRKFARILVFIATTTLLMISVVKTSLALSLGLVGALSIIRFRTPIKEPEELAYLFLAIAIGIGVAADRVAATVVVTAVVLVFLALRARRGGRPISQSLLQVTLPLRANSAAAGSGSGEPELAALIALVKSVSAKADLRRVDRHEDVLNVTVFAELGGPDDIGRILAEIHKSLPGSSVTVVDKDSIE